MTFHEHAQDTHDEGEGRYLVKYFCSFRSNKVIVRAVAQGENEDCIPLDIIGR